MVYRDELEAKIASPDSGLSAGCGCMLWVAGFFGVAVVLGWVEVAFFFEFRLFGPPPTLWERVWPWLFAFGPQSLFIFWYVLIRWRQMRRERRAVGFCASCGYDLRATPQRCPECGLEVAKSGAQR